MARPTVPHCKDCKFLEDRRSFYSWRRYERSEWRCAEIRKDISGQEVRTSPSWCPLRARGLRQASK